MNKRKGFLIGSVLVMLFWCASHYLPTRWNEFSLDNITIDLPSNPSLDIPPLNESERAKLAAILSQSYSYLGKGNQIYAFESADHRYVLKFFQFAHLKPSLYADEKSQKWRLQRIFSSHKLAYDLDKDNTGLVYMQLNQDHGVRYTVDVKDRWGYHRQIDLGHVIFVIQEKTTPSRIVLSDLLDRGEVQTAIQRFQALIALQRSEYSRGIYDQDHNIMHNTGFIGDRAIRFDVGKLAHLNTDPELDLSKIKKRIDRWLQRYYPKHHQVIMETVF